MRPDDRDSSPSRREPSRARISSWGAGIILAITAAHELVGFSRSITHFETLEPSGPGPRAPMFLSDLMLYPVFIPTANLDVVRRFLPGPSGWSLLILNSGVGAAGIYAVIHTVWTRRGRGKACRARDYLAACVTRPPAAVILNAGGSHPRP